MSASGKKPKSVSLIIPIYNEERQLKQFLQEIDRAKFSLRKELILVNDGSMDGSADIIRAFHFKSNVSFIDEKVNAGKGAAIRKGVQAAKGDIIGVQDADFEYKISDIDQILSVLKSGDCDVVYGSRFSRLNPQPQRTFHYLVNRILTFLSNIFSGLYVSDMETCYKFFRREILQNINLESQRFGFEPEITAKIARLKIRLREIPISYFPRNYLEGKKITWRDGAAAIWHLIHFNFFADKKKFFKPAMCPEYLIDKGLSKKPQLFS